MGGTGHIEDPVGHCGRVAWQALGVQEVWSDAWFGARLLVLAAATVALGLWYGTGLRLFPLWAIVRAAIQLSIVALLLRGVLAVPWTAGAFVLLMLSTASITAMGRTRELWRGREAAVVGVVRAAHWSASVPIFALQPRGPGGALRGRHRRHRHRQRDERGHPLRAQLPALGPRPGQRGRGLALPRRHPGRRPPRDRPARPCGSR